MMKKNEKGMTLVEILVAIALFGMTCAVLFTSILFAVNSNKLNHFTGKEMQEQTNAAEYYNDLDNLGENNVIKNNLGGFNNKVSISAVFGTGATAVEFENEDVYAFQSRLQNIDVDAEYSLRFFEPKDNSIVNPDKGLYWVYIYNVSGNEMDGWVVPANKVSFMSYTGNALTLDEGTGFTFDVEDHDTGNDKASFGINLSHLTDSDEDIFFVQQVHTNYYKSGGTDYGEEAYFNMNKSVFDDCCDKDELTGKDTGYVYIYYYEGAYHTLKEYQEHNSTPEAP